MQQSRVYSYRKKDSTKVKRRRHGDFQNFILLALLKRGPSDLESLQKLTSISSAQFEVVGEEYVTRTLDRLSSLRRPAAIRPSSPRKKAEEPEVDVRLECDKLSKEGYVELNDAQKYQLTEKGVEEAERFSEAWCFMMNSTW